MRVDRSTGDVAPNGITINNRIVTRDVASDAGITALIQRYNSFAAPIANRPIGNITAAITRTNDDSLEQSLGNVIADAQLDATDDPGFGDAVLAFMNPGGVRADLTFPSSPAGEGDGVCTSNNRRKEKHLHFPEIKLGKITGLLATEEIGQFGLGRTLVLHNLV